MSLSSSSVVVAGSKNSHNKDEKKKIIELNFHLRHDVIFMQKKTHFVSLFFPILGQCLKSKTYS